MRLVSQTLHGEATEVPGGTARIVSRVDAVVLGPLAVSRHRPIRVEVTREGATTQRRIPDPGFLVSLAAYALTALSIVRRWR